MMVVVVLGCRIVSKRGEPLAGAAGRRARAGAEVARSCGADAVIASGGRAWKGRLEADALADELASAGVDARIVSRETRSWNTLENARYTMRMLDEKRATRVAVVTCAWHMQRALELFRAEARARGLEIAIEPFAAEPGRSTLLASAYRAVRERVAARLDRLFLVLGVIALVACGSAKNVADGSVQDATLDGGSSSELAAIAVAEDTRRAELVTEDMRTSRDVVVRRHAARALARIADGPSETGLLRALGDDDAETLAWGAYGLGFSCKGHEEARVKALVARASSLDVSSEDAGLATASVIDPHFAITRAMGKCGGALAEATLASWVRAKTKTPWRAQAAYGIGDVAARRGSLDDDTVTALLDAAENGVDDALYPFARVERFNEAFAPRLLDAAKKMIAGPKSDVRVFAVRALAKIGEGGVPDLSRVATSGDFDWSERIDAMRSLGKCGDAGRSAAVLALARIVPDPKDAFAVLAAGGDAFGEIVVGLAAIGQSPPPSANKVLGELATFHPAGAPATLERRFAELRCTAASLLARGAFDAALINACDVDGSEPRERARLSALLRGPLVGVRKIAWLALTKSEHLKVREDALAAVGVHAELGDAGLAALSTALADTKHPGVVASAAEVLFEHSERAFVLSPSDIKNALDPTKPLRVDPTKEVSPVIAKALASALAFKWSEDAIETRAGLLDAASVLGIPSAEASAKTACHDANVTMRDHASKALRTLHVIPSCDAPPGAMAAKEITAPHGGKLVLGTDAGTLSITFDADLAPIASTRILDLAKAGFYDNVVVHRVVPAFVVQLGDPQGDGYNGSGKTLRCETSPVPFGPLDVGIALAGRDTGSSQFFVSLGRFPHLDGDYARVGHADGDWFAVAEGDVVRSVKVE
jgi:cyclophilin family peptidyl-prolyl cis-trans isomerase